MELTLKDRLSFGKYRGKTIKNILEEEPDYITWLSLQNKNFTISKDVKDYMIECEYIKIINKVFNKNKTKKNMRYEILQIKQ